MKCSKMDRTDYDSRIAVLRKLRSRCDGRESACFSLKLKCVFLFVGIRESLMTWNILEPVKRTNCSVLGVDERVVASFQNCSSPKFGSAIRLGYNVDLVELKSRKS